MTDEHIVYLGLGSNLGNSIEKLDQACRLLSERVGTVEQCSSYYQTEPWGFESENLFMNAVVRCRTTLSPRQLLRATQRIERRLGRTEKTSSAGDYHDRLIDIDILLYDDLHVDEPDLIIPHPRMRIRPFVMDPLREVYTGRPLE